MDSQETKLYKDKYNIVFYEMDDETFLASFNNIEELCKFRGIEPTNKNKSEIASKIYHCVKKESHVTKLYYGNKNCLLYLIADDDEYEKEETERRLKESMKNKFVRIQSTMSITVTGDMDYIPLPDKSEFGGVIKEGTWKVQQRWSDLRVDIKRGTGYYPAEIVTWKTVKALEDNNILTVGEFTDTCPNQEDVEKVCERIRVYKEQTERLKEKFGIVTPKKTDSSSLADEPKARAVEEEKVEETPKRKKSIDDLLNNLENEEEYL